MGVSNPNKLSAEGQGSCTTAWLHAVCGRQRHHRWTPCWDSVSRTVIYMLTDWVGEHTNRDNKADTLYNPAPNIEYVSLHSFAKDVIKVRRHAAIIKRISRGLFLKDSLSLCPAEKCKACRGKRSTAIRKSLFEFIWAFFEGNCGKMLFSGWEFDETLESLC